MKKFHFFVIMKDNMDAKNASIIIYRVILKIVKLSILEVSLIMCNFWIIILLLKFKNTI